MTRIRACLQQHGAMSVSTLLNSLHSLIALQRSMMVITPDEIISVVLRFDPNMSHIDVQLHFLLLVEVALHQSPPRSRSNAEEFSVHHHLLNNDEAFLYSVVDLLKSHSNGEHFPSIDDFIAQVNSYFEAQYRGANAEAFRPTAAKQNSTNHNNNQEEETEDFRLALERIKIQKQESIGRLLAQFRKFGMEILFPQIVYDKVLACVYAVLLVMPSTSHQELLEIILTIKQARLVPDIQHITKTKIRGVVTLLKHSKLLATHYPHPDQPAHLSLAPGMHTSFQMLRDDLDVFLSSFIVDQHIMMPPSVLQYIVWPKDENTKANKVVELLEIVQQVERWMQSFWIPANKQQVTTTALPKTRVRRDSVTSQGNNSIESNDIFESTSTSSKSNHSFVSDVLSPQITSMDNVAMCELLSIPQRHYSSPHESSPRLNTRMECRDELFAGAIRGNSSVGCQNPNTNRRSSKEEIGSFPNANRGSLYTTGGVHEVRSMNTPVYSIGRGQLHSFQKQVSGVHFNRSSPHQSHHQSTIPYSFHSSSVGVGVGVGGANNSHSQVFHPPYHNDSMMINQQPLLTSPRYYGTEHERNPSQHHQNEHKIASYPRNVQNGSNHPMFSSPQAFQDQQQPHQYVNNNNNNNNNNSPSYSNIIKAHPMYHHGNMLYF